jgi:hypothetical protein
VTQHPRAQKLAPIIRDAEKGTGKQVLVVRVFWRDNVPVFELVFGEGERESEVRLG